MVIQIDHSNYVFGRPKFDQLISPRAVFETTKTTSTRLAKAHESGKHNYFMGRGHFSGSLLAVVIQEATNTVMSRWQIGGLGPVVRELLTNAHCDKISSLPTDPSRSKAWEAALRDQIKSIWLIPCHHVPYYTPLWWLSQQKQLNTHETAENVQAPHHWWRMCAGTTVIAVCRVSYNVLGNNNGRPGLDRYK